MSRAGSLYIAALSGGVDSAVAALRLVRAGHAVEALHMSNWSDDDGYCTAAEDLQDARAVAATLGVPLHHVRFEAEYRERVFAEFLAEHRAGRTPNPDVLCNREIKFGSCLAHARRLGATRLATGHYARILHGAAGAELHQGLDAAKDQSYFLHALDPAVLGQLAFPLGEMDKASVRAEARAAGLPVHAKPDSTGICFIGERPYRSFLAQHLPENRGPIESADGERLGWHRGLAFHTLGQRAGLEIGGRAGRAAAAWYVARKDPASNTLMVVQGEHHPLLYSPALATMPMHWLSPPAARSFNASAKLRHRQPDQPAAVDLDDAGAATLRFTSPQRAVAPGQYAVLYDGTRCLGGARIERTLDERDAVRAEVAASI